MEAFFDGLLHAFHWQNAISIIYTSHTIQRAFGKTLFLNGVMYLGGLAMVEAFYGSPNHKIYGVSYASLTGYPFYLVCLLANARLFSQIAQTAYQRHAHNQAEAYQAHTSTGSIRTIILYSNCALFVFVVRSIPFVGHAAAFLVSCIIMSYYCFEYKWMYLHWTMDECMVYTEQRWPYFLGFGLPATTFTFFLSTLRSGAVFALIYPIFVIMASAAAPDASPKPRQPLPLFLPIRKMNSVALFVLHSLGGPRIEHVFRSKTDTIV